MRGGALAAAAASSLDGGKKGGVVRSKYSIIAHDAALRLLAFRSYKRMRSVIPLLYEFFSERDARPEHAWRNNAHTSLRACTHVLRAVVVPDNRQRAGERASDHARQCAWPRR